MRGGKGISEAGSTRLGQPSQERSRLCGRSRPRRCGTWSGDWCGWRREGTRRTGWRGRPRPARSLSRRSEDTSAHLVIRRKLCTSSRSCSEICPVFVNSSNQAKASNNPLSRIAKWYSSEPYRPPSSPSEDYLTVLAGQRQWIATTNFAGCPGRPPDSFANSVVLATSAKFLMRWAGPSARAFLCRLTPKRNSLSRLWPVHISDHSPFTFSSPRSRNCRNPLPCLIWPNTGSTVCIRKA